MNSPENEPPVLVGAMVPAEELSFVDAAASEAAFADSAHHGDELLAEGFIHPSEVDADVVEMLGVHPQLEAIMAEIPDKAISKALAETFPQTEESVLDQVPQLAIEVVASSEVVDPPDTSIDNIVISDEQLDEVMPTFAAEVHKDFSGHHITQDDKSGLIGPRIDQALPDSDPVLEDQDRHKPDHNLVVPEIVPLDSLRG